MNILAPVYETVRRLRAELPQETTLLGFCGAPWTVATYMIAGGARRTRRRRGCSAIANGWLFGELLDLLADMSADYLIRQFEQGADAVQVFDSWSGVLDEEMFEAFCVKPMKRIVDKVRAAKPDAKIIGFPKGAGMLYRGYRTRRPASMRWGSTGRCRFLCRGTAKEGPIQGNLDPLRVVAGKEPIKDGVDRILGAWATGR
jgi:uroporphyrinogen decarboxylase